MDEQTLARLLNFISERKGIVYTGRILGWDILARVPIHWKYHVVHKILLFYFEALRGTTGIAREG
jgi:hypothetical protein